ncbi:hypothetical protein Sjap_008695 [Stephania japonica]|uniref:Protein kinase domain-containing protein n=1 Tax=Stephania japonica TaxID=461633 RepID=A0AAP0PEQ1_9MAGN
MDPEYMTTAKLTAATGIYRFGIAILQVLTGRGVVNLGFHARDQLIQMAKDVVKGKGGLLDFMDPQLLKHEELLIFDCNKMPDLYRFSEAETKKAIYFCSRHFGSQHDYLEKEVSVLSSILLNNNMEVKLSDLGLAKMLDYKDQSTVSVDLDASSIGYMDPKYMTTAKPTAATDIYRFGSHIASSNRNRSCQSGLPCS